MRTTLRVLLAVLGVSAVVICFAILLAGPTGAALAFEQVYVKIMGGTDPLTAAWPATMDSELRFYAPMFGAYGVLCLTVVRRFDRRLADVPWLAGVFFLGGVGRAVSYVAVGPPHPFFTLLMIVELVLPPVLVGLWLGSKRPARR